LKYVGITIRCEQLGGGHLVTPEWGQLMRFMVGRTRSMFALPFVGAEALVFFMMEFQYTASVRPSVTSAT